MKVSVSHNVLDFATVSTERKLDFAQNDIQMHKRSRDWDQNFHWTGCILRHRVSYVMDVG